MRGIVGPNLVDATISIIIAPIGGDTMAWLNFLYIAVGVIRSTLYFLLTYEHSGVLQPLTRIGRLFIMIGLGAYFG